MSEPKPRPRDRQPPAVRARAWAARLQGPGGTLWYFLRRMREDGIAITAASLCYSTALAVVPALALILGTMTAFPAFDRLRGTVQDFLFSNLIPDTGMKIQQQMETFIAAAGKLTAFGILGLAVTALLLLLTIEGAFFRIFRVTRPRPLLFRIIIFWTVMTVGPFAIALSLSLFGYFSIGMPAGAVGKLISVIFGWLTPTLLTWGFFAFVYVAIPGRRVRWKDALVGAGVSAICFAVLREVFGLYVKGMTSYSAIYGTLAAVPVFLVWIYLIWIVVMAGAVITAALPDWRLMRSGLASGPARKLALALEILRVLYANFRIGTPVTLGKLAVDIGVPEAAILPVLEELRDVRYVAMTEGGHWVLSRDLGQVQLVDIINRLGFGVGPVARDLQHSDLGKRALKHLELAAKSERDLLKIDLAQVVDTGDEAAKKA